MSMPVQRQSDQFSIFDDGVRYANDRTPVEIPDGLIGVLNTSGPRITAGLLNTRQGTAGPDFRKKAPWDLSDDQLDAKINQLKRKHPNGHSDIDAHENEKDSRSREARIAVNTDGMDPNSHAYHQESYGGPYDAGGGWVGDEDGYQAPARDWNPDYGYEPTDEDEHNHELVGEDDDSGYNWGPDPSDHLHPGDIEHSPSAEPFDTPIYNPRSAPYDNITGSRHPFDRTAACQACNGPVYHVSGEGFVHADDDGHEGWELDEHHPAEPDWEDDEQLGLSSLEGWHERNELMDRQSAKTAFAPAPPVPGAHAYQPAHRIGLPWRDQVIPGTVIGLDGPQVAVRWDDGQYSNEEAHNIRPL